MKILALDTALNACSVAVTEGEAAIAHIHEKRRRGHAETLMPMIQSLMKETGLRFADLDLIAVTIGPGTFTGLRIGLATARGIALAAHKPIVGVTTLEALAAAVPEQLAAGRPVIATADARRNEIYLQVFSPGRPNGLPEPLSAPLAIPLEEAHTCLPDEGAVIIGSGGPLLAQQDYFNGAKYSLLDLDEDPDAVIVARLAANRPVPDADAAPPAPLYLRAPDAKLPGGKDAKFL
ncbi:tRNA (adenosine(37)-N6)-threonylcarbamoyltransferase complex dimerization subunit type 1 TsaB [Sneathiella sp.]|uniref:tRNA (adenosine(37)-N6)-threonylcarbamoyltransferase complex dimerization subunit type 1 TsaB n=1 Tax=Sneathiella sp. TaxID=1964365 RepID=UPI003566A6D9